MASAEEWSPFSNINSEEQTPVTKLLGEETIVTSTPMSLEEFFIRF